MTRERQFLTFQSISNVHERRASYSPCFYARTTVWSNIVFHIFKTMKLNDSAHSLKIEPSFIKQESGLPIMKNKDRIINTLQTWTSFLYILTLYSTLFCVALKIGCEHLPRTTTLPTSYWDLKTFENHITPLSTHRISSITWTKNNFFTNREKFNMHESL